MGRKSLKKARKTDPAKTEPWLVLLLPKLQSLDIEALTMDDFARLIGKSKSTLYEYFSSKETLLLESVRIRLRALGELRAMIDLTQGDVKTLYTNYISLISKLVADVSIAFLEAIEKGFPIIWTEILKTMQGIIDDLTQLYTIGIEHKEFKKISILWLIELDRFFITKMIHDSKLWSDQPMSLEQMIQEYLEIRLTGLVN